MHQEVTMNFEVNGQAYVLTFLPNEGSIALFEKDGDEFERMKIVHDDGPMLIATIADEDGPERTPSLN
jgi:hypothetical protein